MVRSSSDGFTLIELLIVMVIIAILSAIAIPQMGESRERALVGSIQNDLRNLMVAQEAYFSENFTYVGNITALDHMIKRSQNVDLVIDSASATGWGAHGTHPAVGIVCRVSVTLARTTNPTCEVP